MAGATNFKRHSLQFTEELTDILSVMAWWETRIPEDGAPMSKAAMVEYFCWEHPVVQQWAMKLGIEQKIRRRPGKNEDQLCRTRTAEEILDEEDYLPIASVTKEIAENWMPSKKAKRSQ